jgi:hypothetical protein
MLAVAQLSAPGGVMPARDARVPPCAFEVESTHAAPRTANAQLGGRAAVSKSYTTLAGELPHAPPTQKEPGPSGGGPRHGLHSASSVGTQLPATQRLARHGIPGAQAVPSASRTLAHAPVCSSQTPARHGPPKLEQSTPRHRVPAPAGQTVAIGSVARSRHADAPAVGELPQTSPAAQVSPHAAQ